MPGTAISRSIPKADMRILLPQMPARRIYGSICMRVLIMSAFIAKGRFKAFMKKIAVRVILNDKAAPLGAARCALEF